ncbi:MAG: hypothetical protein ACR2G3_08715 [Solirubrobacterales bacterium]
MRQALNSNPLVQVGAIALLGVVVAFLLLTRLKGGDPPPADTGAPAPTDAAVSGTEPPPAVGSTPVTPVDPAAPGAPAAAPAGEFVAGPGLPAKVVDAYERGDSVAILITRAGAVEDEQLRSISNRLSGEPGVSFFHSFARDVADFSRITEGADIDRVPALIALSPRDVSGNGPPVATVSYGFRGYESVRQAVRDAGYEGKSLSYDP